MGQEHDGTLLFSWVQHKCTHIGLHNFKNNTLDIVYKFDKQENCVQASINLDRTYLAFILKNINEEEIIYKPFIYKLDIKQLYDLKLERSKQVFIQFLYQKQSILSENHTVKFLVLIHQESKLMLLQNVGK